MARKEKVKDPVEIAEQELEEGAPKKKRTPSRRSVLSKEITAYLLENVNELPAVLQEKINELKSLPSRGARAGGVRGPSITAQIREMILEEKQIHEDVFYNKFKCGRLEMKRKFYNMRKKVADPEEAIWVSFDPETGMYTLEGTGAEPPKNWVN